MAGVFGNLVILVLETLVLVMTGCDRTGRQSHPGAVSPSPARIAARVTAKAPAQYMGSAACIPCHQEEGRKWLGSGHQQTLRFMDSGSLGPLAPPSGTVPGTEGGYVLAVSGSHYTVHPTGNPTRSLLLALALGSGKSGSTYVAVARNQLMEFRQSYFPKTRSWFPTPGSETLKPALPGKAHTPAISRRCILCHATTLPDDRVIPEPRFFGVGCERCHGPGSEHISAITNGKSNDHGMADMSIWPAARINNQCGSCHRRVGDIDLGSDAAASTNRFQPYGLSLSRCFQESGGRLSCVTCHDPHTGVSTNIRRYEQICLSCHSSIAPHSIAGPIPLGDSLSLPRKQPGKICPVNPASGCISCHMPLRKAILDSPLPISMADHWIRIFKDRSP